ncbi:MAG: SCP2 sterol-binding domain-containing protein [Candidatus Promineifilaceae bacterium]|jgi:putative sterol carrier protein
MAYQFATEEWVKALQEELNNSEAYREAAKNWEGDFYFIVEKGQGIAEDIYLYLDLWHGEARQAYLQGDPASKKTAFELRAPLDTWKGVLNKKIDPIKGIMTRQLKLKGNMMKIMKSPKAATELVESAASVETTWPE